MNGHLSVHFHLWSSTNTYWAQYKELWAKRVKTWPLPSSCMGTESKQAAVRQWESECWEQHRVLRVIAPLQGHQLIQSKTIHNGQFPYPSCYIVVCSEPWPEPLISSFWKKSLLPRKRPGQVFLRDAQTTCTRITRENTMKEAVSYFTLLNNNSQSPILVYNTLKNMRAMDLESQIILDNFS